MHAYELFLVFTGPDWNTSDPKGPETEGHVLVAGNRNHCQARGGQLVQAHGILQCRARQRLA